MTLASSLFLGLSIFLAFSVVIYSYFSTFHKAGVLFLKEGDSAFKATLGQNSDSDNDENSTPT